VAMDASAPSPASRADHSRRLTISLSVIAAAVYAEATSERASKPSQMVTTTKSFARS
jgi:citrate synthase